MLFLYIDIENHIHWMVESKKNWNENWMRRILVVENINTLNFAMSRNENLSTWKIWSTMCVWFFSLEFAFASFSLTNYCYHIAFSLSAGDLFNCFSLIFAFFSPFCLHTHFQVAVEMHIVYSIPFSYYILNLIFELRIKTAF